MPDEIFVQLKIRGEWRIAGRATKDAEGVYHLTHIEPGYEAFFKNAYCTGFVLTTDETTSAPASE